VTPRRVQGGGTNVHGMEVVTMSPSYTYNAIVVRVVDGDT